jgi:hypothetical protein
MKEKEDPTLITLNLQPSMRLSPATGHPEKKDSAFRGTAQQIMKKGPSNKLQYFPPGKAPGMP